MSWHWRNSMKTVRFFMFDAKAAGPVFLFLMHARTWTLVLFIISLFVFWTLEKRGLTFAFETLIFLNIFHLLQPSMLITPE